MNYQYIVVAFIITALYDVLLRMFSEEKIKFLGIENINWVVALRGYFKKHTVLGAALIAGFVGAVAYVAILKTMPVQFNNNIVYYMLWVALISAIIGIPMRYSGLFPHLETYYYKPLPITTIFSDALSGVIVAITMILLGNIIKSNLFKKVF